MLRRTPLSARMARRPSTAAAIAGMQSSGAGRQPRLRPPWAETTIASAPISAARSASCTASTPLMVSLPGQIPRSQAHVAPAQPWLDPDGLRNTRAGDCDAERVRIVTVGRHALAHEIARKNPEHPSGMQRHVDPAAQTRAEGNAEPVALIKLPVRRDRRIDRDDQVLTAAGARALQEARRQRTIAPDIELEPERGIRRAAPDRLHGGHRLRRDADGNADAGVCAGELGLAIMRHKPCECRRRQDKGRCDLLTEQHRVEIASVVSHQHRGQQGDGIERGAQARQSHLVLRAAFDILKQSGGRNCRARRR